jgi:TolB-like protein/Tfp pilus assembly protein PilF
VAATLARALAKAPADRFSTIASFAETLGSVPTPAGGRRETPTPSAAGLPGGRVMLAVLPLENLSADPEQEFFTDGMTEELIAHLGRLQPRRLGVIARTSAMRYKKTPKSVEEIGRELGVDHILEGSVRRAGERLRITVQLIQVVDQTHLWAENYDRRMADVFDIQSEVAGSVAKALEVQLLPSGRAAGSVGITTSTAAYEAYLKGRFHWNRRTKEGFDRAIKCFEQAIAEDPTYARAYAGLADVYVVLPAWGLVSIKEVGPKAEMYARRALELDPNLAEAHASLGAVLSNRYNDFEGSEREMRRAIELDPGYVTAYYWLATSLDAQERHDEALAMNERAREMDPQSLVITYNLGTHFVGLREYDRALTHFQAILDLDPGFVSAYMHIGLIRAYRGEHEEGIRFLTRLGPPLRDDWRLVGTLGYLHGLAGHTDEARAALAELERRSTREHIGPIPFARLLLTLGEHEKLFDVLERAIREEEELLDYVLRLSPVFDTMRHDPRFQALVEESKRQVSLRRARSGSGG